MVSQNSYDGIDKYAADLIRHKARQLVGKAGFTEDDRPDLEQELMIDLLQRMRHFNPAKAKKTTFMARIVERHISTILEARFPMPGLAALPNLAQRTPRQRRRRHHRADRLPG